MVSEFSVLKIIIKYLYHFPNLSTRIHGGKLPQRPGESVRVGTVRVRLDLGGSVAHEAHLEVIHHLLRVTVFHFDIDTVRNTQ